MNRFVTIFNLLIIRNADQKSSTAAERSFKLIKSQANIKNHQNPSRQPQN
jgi:hypothetical protein